MEEEMEHRWTGSLIISVILHALLLYWLGPVVGPLSFSLADLVPARESVRVVEWIDALSDEQLIRSATALATARGESFGGPAVTIRGQRWERPETISPSALREEPQPDALATFRGQQSLPNPPDHLAPPSQLNGVTRDQTVEMTVDTGPLASSPAPRSQQGERVHVSFADDLLPDQQPETAPVQVEREFADPSASVAMPSSGRVADPVLLPNEAIAADPIVGNIVFRPQLVVEDEMIRYDDSDSPPFGPVPLEGEETTLSARTRRLPEAAAGPLAAAEPEASAPDELGRPSPLGPVELGVESEPSPVSDETVWQLDRHAQGNEFELTSIPDEKARLTPTIRTFVEPAYPEALQGSGVEGWVIVRLRVNLDGEVIAWEIANWHGDSAFVDAVAEVVEQWDFTVHPAWSLSGQDPFAFTVRVPFQEEQ